MKRERDSAQQLPQEVLGRGVDSGLQDGPKLSDLSSVITPQIIVDSGEVVGFSTEDSERWKELLFLDVVDESLTARLMNTTGVEMDERGVFPAIELRTRIRNLFPDATPREFESFITYFLSVRKDVSLFEDNGIKVYSRDQLLAICSVFHHYIQDDRKKRSLQDAKLKGMASWKNGSTVHNVLAEIVSGGINPVALKQTEEETIQASPSVNDNGDNTIPLEVGAEVILPRIPSEDTVSRYVETMSDQAGDQRIQPSHSRFVDQRAPNPSGIGYTDRYSLDEERLAKINSSRLVRRLRGEYVGGLPTATQSEELPPRKKSKDLRLSPKETSALYEMIIENEERGLGDPNIPTELQHRLKFWNLPEVETLIESFRLDVHQERDRVVDTIKDVDYPTLMSMQYVTIVELQKAGKDVEMVLQKRDLKISSFLPYLKHVRAMMQSMAESRKLKLDDVNQFMLYQRIRVLDGVYAEEL